MALTNFLLSMVGENFWRKTKKNFVKTIWKIYFEKIFEEIRKEKCNKTWGKRRNFHRKFEKNQVKFEVRKNIF